MELLQELEEEEGHPNEKRLLLDKSFLFKVYFASRQLYLLYKHTFSAFWL